MYEFYNHILLLQSIKLFNVLFSEFEFQLGKIISANNHIIEVRNAIHSFFKENPHEVQTIQKFISDVDEPNMTKSKLEEDPEWFKGNW